jgi:rhamnosyltransferase
VRQVSIVIPTLNAGLLFSEVLEGLKSQEYEGVLDLTVVDSGSLDNTPDVAEQHGAKVIRINPGSFDHGLTRNLAIEHVAGEVVVLLSQDAVPGSPQMIRNLVKRFSEPAIAGVYGRQVPRSDADVLTRRNLNGWLTGRKEPIITSFNDIKDYESLLPMRKYMLVNFDNVCAAIRKSVWQDFRFRQSEFAEDLDWSQRVLKAGWKIAYEPAAFVVHSHRRSLSYEYKRTYLCHRKLYKLFGLHTVPSWAYVLTSVPRGTLTDWSYVWRNEGAFLKRVGLLAKTPLLNLISVYAQYAGARDEKKLRVKRVTGV